MKKWKMTKKIMIIAITLVLSLSFSLIVSVAKTSAAEKKVFKWRAVTFAPRSMAEVFKLDWAADQLKKRSGGQLDIKWFYSGELMPSSEILQNIKGGVVEMAHLFGGYVTGVIPEGFIEEGLPGAFRKPHEPYSFLYDSRWNAIEKIRSAYAKQNIYYLHAHKVGVRQDFMFKEPINKLEDLKGKKVRTIGLTANWMEAAGATTAWFPGGEIYSSLATGVVDGVSWEGPSAFWELKAYEIAKYYLPAVTFCVADNSLINLKAWNSLPKDLKLLIELVMAEASTFSTQQTLLEDEIYLEKMVKNWGVKVCKLPPEDYEKWQTMAIPIWDNLGMKHPVNRELIDLLKDWMKWRGYLK